MSLYMLDTNTVSQLTRGHPQVSRRVAATSMESVCISVITEGELLFGLARRPDAHQLHRVVREFLLRVDVLPWTSAEAERYGALRATMQGGGLTLGALDMLIAAHALSANAILVTHDAAFAQSPDLVIQDWEAGSD